MNFKYKCVNVFKEFVLTLRGGHWEVSLDHKKEVADLERGHWKVSQFPCVRRSGEGHRCNV